MKTTSLTQPKIPGRQILKMFEITYKAVQMVREKQSDQPAASPGNDGGGELKRFLDQRTIHEKIGMLMAIKEHGHPGFIEGLQNA